MSNLKQGHPDYLRSLSERHADELDLLDELAAALAVTPPARPDHPTGAKYAERYGLEDANFRVAYLESLVTAAESL
jgi:hypothetical protein